MRPPAPSSPSPPRPTSHRPTSPPQGSAARPARAPAGAPGADAAGARVIVMPMALAASVEATLPLGVSLAERLGADVHLVHVLAGGTGAVSPTAMMRREHEARLRLDAMRMLYRYALPGRAPVAISPVVLEPAPIDDALGAYVATVRAALVLAPAYGHHPAPDGGLAPHVAALVAALPCPVLIVPPGQAVGDLDRLLVSGVLPDGHRGVTASEIAEALGLSTVETEALPRASDLTWIGCPEPVAAAG